MFTGIVSDVGRIVGVEARGDLRVTIETAYDPSTIDLGASIACSGVCLTVVDKVAREGGGGRFSVDVSGETIARTASTQWAEGRRLNLERAMKLGDELGGHIVTGHVDGVAEIVAIDDLSGGADTGTGGGGGAGEGWAGGSKRITFAVPPALAPFLAPKGSVTIDGVSLTVNTVEDAAETTRFTINLIPHTQSVTTLGGLQTGQGVNVEIDVLARYLKRMEHYRGR